MQEHGRSRVGAGQELELEQEKGRSRGGAAHEHGRSRAGVGQEHPR